MRLVRCTVRPSQVDDVVDALEAFDLASLVVTSGGERSRGRETVIYRGCEYKVRLRQTALVEIIAPDDVLEDVVRAVTDVCSADSSAGEGLIFVTPVNEWYHVRHRPRRIA